MRAKLLATTIAASVLLAACGLFVLYRCRYRMPLTAVEKMAAAIPGVVVVDSGGNLDVTLQDLWLDIEFRGHTIALVNVTEESFRGGGKVDVAAFDRWRFVCRGFASGADPQTEREVRTSAFIEFGRNGLMTQVLPRSLGSVGEFLDSIEDVESVILGLPVEAPGVCIGVDKSLYDEPLDIWVRKRAADR